MPMQTGMLVKQETATNGKLHLFSLYVDFSASICARRVAGAVSRLAGANWKTSSEMWKLDSLSISEPIKNMIARDAANADVIVVAMSSLERPPVEVVQWLDSLAAWKPGHSAPGLLIGLLGDKETKTAELDWTVKPLINCAQRAGRSFIWHWMGEFTVDDSCWLAEDLESLLAAKLSANRGVILDAVPQAHVAANLGD